MAVLRPRRHDHETLALFEEAGRNVHRSALLLRDLLADWPEQRDLGRLLVVAEHEGDRITHDILHRLNGGGGGSVPFDVHDGHALASALDDVVDFAEQTGDALTTYGVEAAMEQASELAGVLVLAAEQVAAALRTLRTGSDARDQLVEIHRLENEGDRISREAISSLFANGIDPMVVIRWKDIFESLEAAVDACEKVANVLEGIDLKRRRRR